MKTKVSDTTALIAMRNQAIEATADPTTGQISAQSILEAARDPKHVLHSDFEWDDSIAGEAFRLVQAEGLIRRYKVTVIRLDPQTKKMKVLVTRGVVSLPSNRGPSGNYETIGNVLNDPTKRRELLEMALRELEAMKQKYSVLEELARVWEAVEKLEESR